MKHDSDKQATRPRRRVRRRAGEPVVVRVEVEIDPGGRAWTRNRAGRHDSGPRRALAGELIEDVIWRRHT